MENTIENKAKFFAQYWGQGILNQGYVDWDSTNVSKIKPATISAFRTNSDDDSFIAYLQLTPLSKITEEDVIRMIKIVHGLLNDSTALMTGRRLIVSFEDDFDNLDYNICDGGKMCDYLRSKG